MATPIDTPTDGTAPAPASRASGDRLAIAGLLLLVLLLFHSAVMGRGVFYYRDIHLFWHPQIDAFVRSLAAGAWPVWNPYMGFGRPLLGNPNVQVYYPPTWLTLVLRPGTYYTLYVLAHFTFTAVGFFLVARRFGLSRGASFVGAAIWTASGPLTSLVSFWNYLAGACWFPWTFLAADRALESGRVGPALGWGACVAAPILAGSPEMALLNTIAVGAFVLRSLRWRRPWVAENARIVRPTIVAAIFALGLSAAQWLPTVAISEGTQRLDIAAAARTFWSVHPASLFQMVVPAPLADLPLRPEIRGALFEGREPMLPSLYLGAGAVGLVGAALAMSGHPLRRFVAILGLLALVMALGRHTPVYEVVARLVPPVRAIRYPAKAMPMVALAWALLAAMGWDAWAGRDAAPPGKWRLLVVAPLAATVALGLAALWLGWIRAEAWAPRWLAPDGLSSAVTPILAPTVRHVALAAAVAAALLVLSVRRRWPMPSTAMGALVGTLVVGDLIAAHHDPSPLASPEVFTTRPPVVDLIANEPHSRVYSYDYADPGLSLRQQPLAVSPEAVAGRRDQWPVPWVPALAARERMYFPLVGVWGLEGSFHRDTLGLYPPYLIWLNLLERAGEGTPLMVKMLRLGSVSHVVALHDQGFEALVPVAQVPSHLVEKVRLFRVPDPFPRVYAVGGARVGDGREGLGLLGDPGFDPAREVLLASGEPRPAPAEFHGETKILEWRPDRLRLESRLDRPGYVVLAEAYEAGWRGRVDGADVPVHRANIGLRAIEVPAGTHTIDLAYRPPAVAIGLVLSGLSVLVAAGAAVASIRRPRAA